jgi:hypothetical protein
MTHIAIEEAVDGKWAGWMEKVSNEQEGQFSLNKTQVTNSGLRPPPEIGCKERIFCNVSKDDCGTVHRCTRQS